MILKKSRLLLLICLVTQTFLLHPTAADNAAIAQERAARLYELFQNSIFRNYPNSRAAFVMLSLGIGTDFSPQSSAIDIQEIANTIANQRVLARGSSAEIIGLGPITPYYKAFIDNHQTVQPAADQQLKMDKLQDAIAACATPYETALTAYLTKTASNFTRYYTGAIPFSNLTRYDGAAKTAFDSNPDVRKMKSAKNARNREIATLGDAIWRWRQAKVQEGEDSEWNVQFVPALNKLTNNDGWTSIEIMTKHLDQEKSKSTTTGSYSRGGFFFRANLDYKKVTEDENKIIDDMTVRFQVKRVTCLRRWLDTGAFLDDTYKPIKPKKEMSLLSTGSYDKDGYYGGNGKEGECPLIVTDLIFVKDVTLTAPWKKEHYSFASEATSGTASLSFGPFRLGNAGGNHSWERTKTTVDEANKTIKIETPQLIGFIVYKVPESPIR